MVPWEEIVGCCLGAAALYLFGIKNDCDADFLNSSVIRVKQLNGLAKLLDNASKLSPLIVSISGRVNSVTPINCERTGLQYVIMKESKEKYFLKRNAAGKWICNSTLISSNLKEVPWYLDDGTARVNVVGAKDAARLELTVGKEDQEDFKRSLMGKPLDDSDGIKMLGVKRVIRVLPTGTLVTVVGEVVRDNTGTIRVQRPRNGPFCVSHKTIHQLISNHQDCASVCKFVSMGLIVVGVYLVAQPTFQHIWGGVIGNYDDKGAVTCAVELIRLRLHGHQKQER